MTDTPNTPPAGYYDDGSGRQRWWDGVQWTEHFQDAPAPPATPAPPTQQTSTQYATEPALGATAVTTANPKADAKAAKAYAKANRPWYKKKRWWAAIVVVIIIIAAAAGSGGGSGGDDNAGKKASTSSTDSKKDSGNSGKKSTAKPSAFGSDKFPLQNGDWRLDSMQVKSDGFGGWSATGRVTYTGKDKRGGNNLFTVTLFKGKDVVGTLAGGGNTVAPGSTVTVQFLETGSNKYVAGPYKYDFQNDL